MTSWLESLKTNLINFHDLSLKVDFPQCEENLHELIPSEVSV